MKVFLPATAVTFFIGRILGGPGGQTEKEKEDKSQSTLWGAGRGILGIKGRGEKKGTWGEGEGKKCRKRERLRCLNIHYLTVVAQEHKCWSWFKMIQLNVFKIVILILDCNVLSLWLQYLLKALKDLRHPQMQTQKWTDCISDFIFDVKGECTHVP